MRTSTPIVRRALRLGGGDAGISLIEVVFAMVLFAVVAAAVAGALTSAVASHGLSRERTIAQQLAQEQIESIRRLPYDQVGTIAGNPPGLVDPSRLIGTAGLSARLNTQIRFENDPTPNSYSATAHYKRVIVTVARERDLKRLFRSVTYIAPRGALFGGITNATINAQVIDFALNTPIEDAEVDLRTGPSAPRNAETDAGGMVSFAGLTANPLVGPQAFYDLFVVDISNYVVLREDVPPAAPAHVQLAPGQTFDTVLRIYLPSKINIYVQDSFGNPYPGTATVSVGSSRASEEFPVTGGSRTITDLGGEPLVSGLPYTVGARVDPPGPLEFFARAVTQPVPDGYPNDLESDFTLRLLPSTSGRINVRVRTASNNPVPGARVVVNGGPFPVYLTSLANPGGVADFDLPPGPGYTVTATGVNGEGTGTITATAPANGTNPVTVVVASGGP
jgi:type II secretory pathway pseudopilin PulG